MKWVIILAVLGQARGYGRGGFVDTDRDYDNFMELVARENERGLFPNIFNLATNAIIQTNATCGQDGAKSFCKLVEHVFLRQPQCDICDDNNPGKRHPIQYAIDGTNNWWQSPTLASGLQYETITITLDLRQQYQVAYVILKAAISPRPGTWALERSMDKVEWKPWMYFATTDAECQKQFGLPATRGHPRYTSDTEVVCTSMYSKLDPLENGEVHVSLVNGRPGVDGPSIELQNFTRARHVRFRFLKLRTLNADLMTISRGQLDDSVTRRYFYAIKDISIGGQCICYGHAETCPVDPATGQLRCECRHNTCGESCEKCCPLYHQREWKQGTNIEPHMCEPCQCYNHADECVWDADVERLGSSMTPEGVYEGGGVCVDCKHNTQGINCEQCKDGYYRPTGVSHYSQNPCVPCDCDLEGSVDENCVKDETHSDRDRGTPGDCICKPGFGGRRCDQCEPGFRNYPLCDPCPCNKAGSSNFATCEDDCICKKNVEGERCESCKAGFINLDERNPDGCQPCFCFGKSDQCTESQVDGYWGTREIQYLKNWNLTDVYGTLNIVPEGEIGNSLTYTKREGGERIDFWKAPPEYTGNKLASYGGYLRYFVYYVPETEMEDGRGYSLPDIVVQGNGVKLEHYTRQNIFERENVSISVRLHESSDWLDASTRRPVNKITFMRALVSVDNLYLRAVYHLNQLQSSLYGVSLEIADKDVEVTEKNEETALRSVETCTCPRDYTGLSCETCEVGFRRVDNKLYDGLCVECNCNEHSQTCDPYTGACQNCSRNTGGTRCELCLPGYYGNPSLGGEEGACKPCECPSQQNNFSPTCILNDGENDHVCTACQPGYVGQKCEICADGYFGDPTAVNGTCQRCDCNNNIDPAAVGNCNRKTGLCEKCIGNTQGDHCEECKEEFWGSALDHDCRPCDCNFDGTAVMQCNLTTGICECHDNFIGPKCDRCKEGHGDVSSGCHECECDEVGSLNPGWCDPVSGQCQCKPGVFGKSCKECTSGYFGFSDDGCQFCGCDKDGAIDDGKCDTVTGKCECRDNVIGISCNECEKGFFNISSKQGCLPCECAEGAESATCDPYSGICNCKSGVAGDKCDKCAPNYYGYGIDGCTECPVCKAAGQVCDPDSGECICPPNTNGEYCENCDEFSWDHHPLEGCKLCDCNEDGSEGKECDVQTGQCKCLENFTGLKCNQCNHGHFNHPTCEKCDCQPDGSDPASCIDGLCGCDEEGKCRCKPNVQGDKCDQCDSDSFSLDGSYPQGCFNCFCFGRGSFCVQATAEWQQIFADDRSVFFMEPYSRYDVIHSLRVLPDEPPTVYSYPTDSTPLYWAIPKFQGDKVESYNGFLRFRMSNKEGNYMGGNLRPDRDLYQRYPLVFLIGNDRIELEYYPMEPAPENGRYKIRLREDLWKSRRTPDIPVTREQFMIALQRVQAVYIRATFSRRVKEGTMSDIMLDVAVREGTNNGTDVSTIAFGVEDCGDCPAGYDGSSCQDPASGYCRKRATNRLNDPTDLTLVGVSEPCACHGHSTDCDMESCRCIGCEHNATGEFCEHCKEGFYGDATLGTPNDCKQCACPLLSNSFSKTCYSVPHGKGYVCNACEEGYTGQQCEACAQNYYGDPTVEGGSCKPCACNPSGSLSRTCNQRTGQCECREEVTGRDCSDCRPRHALIGAQCVSCDQGCTTDLLIELDRASETLQNHNLSGVIPVPWKPLRALENLAKSLDDRFMNIEEGGGELQKLVSEIDGSDVHRSEAERVLDQSQYVKNRATYSQERLEEFIESADQAYDDIYQAKSTAAIVHEKLKNFKGIKNGPNEDTAKMVENATQILRTMKETDADLEKRFNRAEMELLRSKELLERMLSKKFDDTIFESLHERLADFSDRVADAYTTAWDTARKNTNSARNISAINEKRMEQFEEVVGTCEDLRGEIEDYSDEINEMMKAGGLTNADAWSFGQSLNVSDTNSLINDLADQTNKTHLRANQYSELLLEYAQKYKNPATSHAEKLEMEAAQVSNAFASTKDLSQLAVAASEAYNTIIDGLQNATSAANAAKTKAEMTNDRVTREEADAGGSLVEQAEKEKEESINLYKEATANSAKDTEKKVLELEEKLGNISDGVDNGDQELTAAINALDSQEKRQKLNDDIKKATDTATQALNEATEKDSEIQEIVEKVDLLAQQMEDMGKFTGAGVRELSAQVNSSKDAVSAATAALIQAQEQANKNENDAAMVEDKLIRLKEKIQEARDKASKIKVAVTSKDPGDCVRAYTLPSAPSPVDNIRVRYRPLKPEARDAVEDSLIWLTRTEARRTQPSEYMSLETKDGNLVFRWNIGGKDRSLTLFGFKIVYLLDGAGKHEWYEIQIERKGYSATLNASIVNLAGGQAVFSNSSEMVILREDDRNFRIFNSEPGKTTIQLGAEKGEQPALASTHKFKGTVGELLVGGKKLSLWDFVTTTKCTGGVAADTATSNTGVLFRYGYAVVGLQDQSQYSSTSLTMSLVFSTYSSDGLLYFRGNEEKGDFIAVALKNGHVDLHVSLGGISRLTISSAEEFNDGKKHAILITRQGKSATLNVTRTGADGVDYTDTASEIAPGGNTGLEIRNANHSVGGVPRSLDRSKFDTDQYQVPWEGFYGCIEQLYPNLNVQRSLPLKLTAAYKAINIEIGCPASKQGGLQTSDRVVSIAPGPNNANGFFVISGLTLERNGSFAFGFRTKQESAILLYQSSRVSAKTRRVRDASGNGFLASYLYRGALVVVLGTDSKGRRGESVTTLSTDKAFNDGLTHSVFIERKMDSDQVVMRVDDKIEILGELKDSDTIGDSGAQLFIGGFPKGTKPASEEMPPTVQPLSGCISDLYNNYNLMSLLPELQSYSKLGVCNVKLPTTREMEPQSDGESFAKLKADRLEHSRTVSIGGGRATEDTFPSISPTVQGVQCPAAKKLTNWPKGEETAVRFGQFESGDSYSEVNLKTIGPRKYSKPANITIGFSFKTNSPNGQLFFWANKKFKQFMNATLDDGQMTFEIVKGSKKGNSRVTTKGRYDDGQWHTVSMVKLMREVSLSVDSEELELSNVPVSIRILRRRFFVGGFPEKLKLKRGFVTPNFVGCIKDFTMNERPLNVIRFGKGVLPCAFSQSDITSRVFLHPGAQLTYKLSESKKEQSFVTQFTFTATKPDLRVLTLTGTGLYTAEVNLNDGQLMTATLKYEGQDVSEAAVRTENLICDGKPNSLRLRLGERLILSVNGEAASADIPATDSSSPSFAFSHLHVGRPPSDNAIEGTADGMTGCVSNVVVTGRSLEVEDGRRAVFTMCPT